MRYAKIDTESERQKKIILIAVCSFIMFLTLVWITWDSSGAEVNEVESLRKRVKELEVEQLKLRLNLADEKLVNARMEFNMLSMERSRICNELSATDQKTWTDRCTERGTK